MAGSVNKAIILGNLGRDPESRAMQNGDSVVNLSVATSETWKKDGERREKTEWHRVVIFNEGLAKIAEQYCKKGSQIYIEGQLQTRKWTDKDSIERYSTEVVLQGFNASLGLLDSKPQSAAGEHEQERAADARQADRVARPSLKDELDDGEIPF